MGREADSYLLPSATVLNKCLACIFLYKLTSKVRVPAKWQANYVSLVIFMCKPRSAAEQNMTIRFVDDIGYYFMLD